MSLTPEQATQAAVRNVERIYATWRSFTLGAATKTQAEAMKIDEAILNLRHTVTEHDNPAAISAAKVRLAIIEEFELSRHSKTVDTLNAIELKHLRSAESPARAVHSPEDISPLAVTAIPLKAPGASW